MIAAASGVAAAALSVTPERLRLTGSAARTIAITNTGDSPTVVVARPAGLALDGRGMPTLAGRPQPAASWIHARPSRVAIAPGARAVISVSSTAPSTASHGDHPVLVLLTTQPRPGAGVAIRVRIGVVVFVRVPGKIVHRLAISAVAARRGTLTVAVANRGNVAERVRARVVLRRTGRTLARLGPIERTLLPHARARLEFGYRRRLHGVLTAMVEIGRLRRTLRLRL